MAVVNFITLGFLDNAKDFFGGSIHVRTCITNDSKAAVDSFINKFPSRA